MKCDIRQILTFTLSLWDVSWTITWHFLVWYLVIYEYARVTHHVFENTLLASHKRKMICSNLIRNEPNFNTLTPTHGTSHQPQRFGDSHLNDNDWEREAALRGLRTTSHSDAHLVRVVCDCEWRQSCQATLHFPAWSHGQFFYRYRCVGLGGNVLDCESGRTCFSRKQLLFTWSGVISTPTNIWSPSTPDLNPLVNYVWGIVERETNQQQNNNNY